MERVVRDAPDIEQAQGGAGGEASSRDRARWIALAVVAAGMLLVLAFHLGGGWYFADRLNDRALSAESRREALMRDYTIDVVAVDGQTVTLRKPGEARLRRNGTFGLLWNDGWGTIGAVLGDLPDGSVVRAFQNHGNDPLRGGMRVALETRVYQEDPLAGRGIPFEDVVFEGELGRYPAWYVPGQGTTWFILVHGNSMTRLDGLRMLPAAVESGMPALLPAYRNDPEAPEDPGGRLTYGKNEWRDVEAAVQYALASGAQSVVIEGMSMGGGVVVAFLLESSLADYVSGVILDAPVLSFERSVEHQAKDESLPFIRLPLPGTLVDSAEWIARLRFGVDWEYTDYLDRVDELETPILLIHGGDDGTVPEETSADLAERRPDLVLDYYVVPDAGHVEVWNADPAEYERRVLAFLEAIGARN